MTSTGAQTAWGNETNMLAAAEHHIKTALHQVSSTAQLVRMDAVVHAGSAVELTCKVLLLRVNPLLLHFATPNVLLASVSPQHPVATSGKSIDVRAALEIALRVYPSLKPHKGEVDSLNKRRNAIVHMAIDDPNPARSVKAAEQFTSDCLALLNVSTASVFGAQRASQLKAEAEGRALAILKQAEKLVREAAERYTASVAGLDAAERAERDRALVHANQDPRDDDGFEIECPACGFEEAWLSQEAEVEQDFDGAFYSGLRINGLDCPRCQLSLDDLELDALRIDTTDPREPDWLDDPRDD